MNCSVAARVNLAARQKAKKSHQHRFSKWLTTSGSLLKGNTHIHQGIKGYFKTNCDVPCAENVVL